MTNVDLNLKSYKERSMYIEKISGYGTMVKVRYKPNNLEHFWLGYTSYWGNHKTVLTFQTECKFT